MTKIKFCFMNEIHDLRRKTLSFQLKLQQEKLNQSGKNNVCGKDEKLIIADLRKTKLHSYQSKNELLKHKMIQKRRMI